MNATKKSVEDVLRIQLRFARAAVFFLILNIILNLVTPSRWYQWIVPVVGLVVLTVAKFVRQYTLDKIVRRIGR